MAKIVEYESPLSARGLNPSAKGVQAEEAVASGALSTARSTATSLRQEGQEYGSTIKDAGGAVAQGYQQFVVNPELSKGAAVASGLQDTLTNRWNALAAHSDPNDASIKQKFIDDELNPALNKFKEAFTTTDGQNYAEKEANRFTEHMLAKTTADMSVRAGQALQVNMESTKNNLSNMVRSDPSSFDHAVEMWGSSVRDTVAGSKNIDADSAAKATGILSQHGKAELARAAVLGTAEKSPEAAKALLDSGKFNNLVDGVEMSKMIKTLSIAQRQDAALAKSAAKEKAEIASASARDEYVKSVFSKGDTAPNITQHAITDPSLLPLDREHILNLVAGKLKPEAAAASSARITQQLFSQIISSDPTQRITDTLPISKAFAEGKVGRTDFEFLMKNFTDMRSPDGQKLGAQMDNFLEAKKKQITQSNPLMGKVDPSGDEQLYNFQQYVRTKVDTERKAGGDPADLFNPNSPKYLGSPKEVEPFQKTLQNSLMDQAKRMAQSAGNTVVNRAAEPTAPQNTPVPTGTPVVRVPISGAPVAPVVQIGGKPQTAVLAPDGKTFMIEVRPGEWHVLVKREKK